MHTNLNVIVAVVLLFSVYSAQGDIRIVSGTTAFKDSLTIPFFLPAADGDENYNIVQWINYTITVNNQYNNTFEVQFPYTTSVAATYQINNMLTFSMLQCGNSSCPLPWTELLTPYVIIYSLDNSTAIYNFVTEYQTPSNPYAADIIFFVLCAGVICVAVLCFYCLLRPHYKHKAYITIADSV